ncbi:hypothetical protein [Siminovitchia fordii]|uniref:Uncharacterized protein n=1 Tax=Siminovitchia fordii TaxID=254759 RepID=A0ABQ4KA59_9BACI|nr:hypothetical protein [Siminovitchia fordii]GIN22614.1 hypothetical protein J1TS3_37480 [Siminovitchia fordii]
MGFYEELDNADMEIDYEMNWEENARLELDKLNQELLLKGINMKGREADE